MLNTSESTYRKNRSRRSMNDRCRRLRIKPEDIRKAFVEQKGRCAICQVLLDKEGKNGWHGDHNHSLIGRLRGILCCHCNRLVGACKEDVEILKKAIAYLEREFVAY